MRIISKFKDYYDCIQGMGQDQTLVYLRNKKELEYKEQPHLPSVHLYYKYKTIYIRSHTVGFCGRLYPILQMKFCDDSKDFALEPKASKIGLTTCFNIDDVDDFMKANAKEDQLERYFSKKGEYGRFFFSRTPFLKSFNEFDKHKDAYKSLFEEYRSPIFIQSSSNNVTANRNTKLGWELLNKFCINGNLKEVEFYKIFDPYQAFQEISMFLGNMASPEKEIPKLDDVVMAEIKGFDKWSFRKEPKKGKKNV